MSFKILYWYCLIFPPLYELFPLNFCWLSSWELCFSYWFSLVGFFFSLLHGLDFSYIRLFLVLLHRAVKDGRLQLRMNGRRAKRQRARGFLAAVLLLLRWSMAWPLGVSDRSRKRNGVLGNIFCIQVLVNYLVILYFASQKGTTFLLLLNIFVSIYTLLE